MHELIEAILAISQLMYKIPDSKADIFFAS